MIIAISKSFSEPTDVLKTRKTTRDSRWKEKNAILKKVGILEQTTQEAIQSICEITNRNEIVDSKRKKKTDINQKITSVLNLRITEEDCLKPPKILFAI